MNVMQKYRVIKPHEKKDGGELTLNIGDIVEVIKQGRYLWYGQTKNSKGFFPCENVEAIEEGALKTNSENILSTTVTDKENSKSTVEQAVDSAISDETFEEIKPTTLLTDKRRSRVKSTGRPPSQVFIKGNMLLRTQSMEFELESDNDSSEEQEKEDSTPSGVSPKITSISQLVTELKQKPNLKTVLQKDTVTTTTTISSGNSADVPEWLKGLPKKKVSTVNVIKKSDDQGNIPPWMKEVLRKREHKLSLRGDEVLPNAENPSQQNGNIKQAKIEIQTYETRATNHTTVQEKHSTQTSVKVENRVLGVNNTNIIESSVQTTENKMAITCSLPKNADVIGNMEKSNAEKQKQITLETKANDLQPKEDVAEILPIDDVKQLAVSVTNVKSTSGADLISHVLRPIQTDEKIEFIPELHEEELHIPKPSPNEADDNKSNTREYIIPKMEKQALVFVKPNYVKESKIPDSLKEIVKKIEDFQVDSETRLGRLQTQIQNLQLSIDQHHEEAVTFIQQMKSELSELI